MKTKRKLSLCLLIISVVLISVSLTAVKQITGAVTGVNSNSKYLAIFGILFMAVAIFVERYKTKDDKNQEKRESKK